jgi:hypothetical protein
LVHDGHVLKINFADGIGYPITDKDMAAITSRSESMCAFAGGYRLDLLRAVAADIVNLNPIPTGQPNQQEPVIGGAEYIGGQRAGLAPPHQFL